MDSKDYLNTPLGIPLDPDKQKDPDVDGDVVPAEGRAGFLNDVTDQDGGQRTETEHPWDGEGDLQAGQREAYLKSIDRKKWRRWWY
ncbi:hypothetical protein LY474_35915 [Myxococcus stipitatus]|uniref:hypothetical protein n=1 Tax=Myxococcus stipitatus TaxID=83455 RepID=UPI001F2A30FE|nr:hypothetical protein [Myxococcus stipitatus]MCE9673208.1 hypothetical protein [Myxococcus stipitatus]